MKQQILVSGIGGQGVILATRILAEAAMEAGHDILASETHGMAMRGGTVISHVKIGAFKSPLIRKGQADTGLFLHQMNLDIHGPLMKKEGHLYVNASSPVEAPSIDATGLAKEAGSAVVANLVLLGFAISGGRLFCNAELAEKVIRSISQPKQLEMNLRGFHIGLAAGKKSFSAE